MVRTSSFGLAASAAAALFCLESCGGGSGDDGMLQNGGAAGFSFGGCVCEGQGDKATWECEAKQ